MPKAPCEQLCPVPVPRISVGMSRTRLLGGWAPSLFLILHLPPGLGGARECPGYHRLRWLGDRTHLVAAVLMFSWDRAVPKGQRQEINPCPMEEGRVIPLLSRDSSLRQAGQGSCQLLLHSPHCPFPLPRRQSGCFRVFPNGHLLHSHLPHSSPR